MDSLPVAVMYQHKWVLEVAHMHSQHLQFWKLLLLLLLSCFSHVRLLATPWTAAYQAPLSMGFSRQENLQEYWSRLPLPSLVLEAKSLKSVSLD